MADQSSSAVLHTFKNQHLRRTEELLASSGNVTRPEEQKKKKKKYITECPCDSKPQHARKKCHHGSSLRIIHLFIPSLLQQLQQNRGKCRSAEICSITSNTQRSRSIQPSQHFFFLEEEEEC